MNGEQGRKEGKKNVDQDEDQIILLDFFGT
jgi:hypothetical protein